MHSMKNFNSTMQRIYLPSCEISCFLEIVVSEHSLVDLANEGGF